MKKALRLQGLLLRFAGISVGGGDVQLLQDAFELADVRGKVALREMLRCAVYDSVPYPPQDFYFNAVARQLVCAFQDSDGLCGRYYLLRPGYYACIGNQVVLESLPVLQEKP